MKFNILFIILFSFNFCLEAKTLNQRESKFHLTIDASGSKDQKVYLARYWEGKPYKIDSTIVSQEGIADFANADNLPQGQYLIYLNPDISLELLLGDEQDDIKIVVDSADVQDSWVTGSKDTELFWTYLRFLNKKTGEQTSLADKLDGERLTNKERGDINKRISEIDDEVKKYVDDQINAYANTWYGVFLKGAIAVDLPIAEPKNVDEFNINKAYLKAHYFDNVNLSDSRFWYTHYLASYLDYYIDNVVDQASDSIALATEMLVEKSSGDDLSFERMLSRYTNWSLGSNVMGMENVWMHLYEKFIRGKNLSWIDSTKYNTLEQLYQISENCRIGMKAHDLELDLLGGGKINTKDVGKEYTLLYFYNPTCTHCIHEIPLIKENLYDKYKDKGLTVVGVYLDSNTEGWASFVEKNNIQDWINCADKNFTSKYWLYYDTSKTPATYLLDENKMIIAKMVDSNNLEKVLSYYIKY